ncbi:hypothetical protein [Haloferax volcanii]|uniref:hypothetical protein n=1 Tax=Haloferax volcanii TaxID=2246 RepID=UPI003851997C
MSDEKDEKKEKRVDEDSLEKARVADVSTDDPREEASEDSAEASAEDSEGE